MRGNVRERSRKAVELAGTRARNGVVKSAHAWTEMSGKRAEGPWRPGKTQSGLKRPRKSDV